MTTNRKLVFKIIMWALLLHVILIALTVLEVFIYSTFVNTGQDSQFYESHAQKSGPYIGIIIGFTLTYLVASRLAKKNPTDMRLICLGLPVGYIVLDVVMLLPLDTEILGSAWIFAVSYITKLLAGYLVWRTNK